MKNSLILLLIMSMMIPVSSCNKSGCPTGQTKTGEYYMKKKRNKTKSGLFGRRMYQVIPNHQYLIQK